MSSVHSVRQLAPDDLSAVTSIHVAAFPKQALTKLGKDVVQRYYQWQLHGPHECVAAVCSVEGTLAGFVFAGVFRGEMSGFLRANMTFLTLRLALRPWLLLDELIRERVKLAWRLLRKHHSIRAQHGTAGRMAPASRAPAEFDVLSVAVLPTHEGRGIGAALMHFVEDVAVRKGFQHIHLYVNPGNRKAVQFYEKLGWRRAYDGYETHGRMEKALPLPSYR